MWVAFKSPFSFHIGMKSDTSEVNSFHLWRFCNLSELKPLKLLERKRCRRQQKQNHACETQNSLYNKYPRHELENGSKITITVSDNRVFNVSWRLMKLKGQRLRARWYLVYFLSSTALTHILHPQCDNEKHNILGNSLVLFGWIHLPSWHDCFRN